MDEKAAKINIEQLDTDTEKEKLMQSFIGADDQYDDPEGFGGQERIVKNKGGQLGVMQMAPLPGQSNFAIVQRDSKSGQDFHRQLVNSKHYGKTASALVNNQPDNVNINEILIPREDKKSTGCCFRIFCPCYYLFCCCCCCEQGFKVTRMRFVARFQKWINVVSKLIHIHNFVNNFVFKFQQKKEHFLSLAPDDPVRGLLQLYAHQENAVKDLEQCRINPDFNSPFRNDLEYYIP